MKIAKKTYEGINFFDKKYSGGEKGLAGFREACDIKNIRLKDTGIVIRKGRTRVNGATPIAESLHSIDYFEAYSGNNYLIVGAGDKIYTDDGAGGVPVLSDTLATGDIPATMESYLRQLWYVDGVNDNQKWDGTTWSRLGVVAPSAAPVAVAGAAGVLIGTYWYRYVYVAKNGAILYEVESATSATSTPITAIAPGQQINVTVIASADPQVTNIRIYRLSTVAATWKLVVELTNANAVYSDNIADASLGLEMVNPTEGEPLDETMTAVKFEGICKWKSHMWGWADDMLYVSVEGRPEKWYSDQSAASGLKPMRMDAKIIRCIPIDNYFIVLCKNRMYAITGSGTTFAIMDVQKNLGCVAARTARETPWGLAWLSNTGICLWRPGAKPEVLSRPIKNDTEGQSRGIFDSSNSALQYAAAVYDDEESAYKISVPYGESVYNVRTFVLDFDALERGHNPWLLDDYGFMDAVFTPDRKLYTATSVTTGGVVDRAYYHLENTGYQDDGADISAWYETRHSDFGNSSTDKNLLRYAIEAYTESTSISVKTFFDLGNKVDICSIDPTGDKWDEAKWDEGYWGGAQEASRYNNYCAGAYGMKVGFRVEMSGRAYFHSIEVIYKEVERPKS